MNQVIKLCLMGLSLALSRNYSKEQRTVIGFNIDLLCHEDDPDIAALESAKAGKKLFSSFSRGMTGIKLWRNEDAISKRGKELAKLDTGATNVTHKLLSGYGVRENEIFELTKAAINPRFKEQELALLENIKRHGYTIIGITGQDEMHHQFFREKSTAYGIEDMLSGVITIAYIGGDPLDPSKKYRAHKDHPHWYIVHPNCQDSCCNALKELAHKLKPQAPIIIIDNKQMPIAQEGIKHVTYQNKAQIEALLDLKSAEK